MPMINFIDRMNAEFEKQAADLALRDKVDATIQQMKRNPHKLAAITEMEYHLETLVEDALAAELSAQKLRPQDIKRKDALVQIADDVFERVSSENPKILRPLIQREAAYYVTATILTAAIRSNREIPPQNYGPK